MSLLSVVSPKGGVGKTTLALNLAYGFVRRGWETALVDLDPLGGLGRSLSPEPSPGLWEVVQEGLLLGRVLDWGEGEDEPRPALLGAGEPGGEQMGSWARRLTTGEDLAPVFQALRRRFPVVLVDTPAGLTGPTRGALLHSTHLLSPVQAEPLALRTLPALLDALAALREEGLEAELVGLVATMVRSRETVSLAAAQELFRLMPRGLVLESFVPWDPAFLQASARGEPVTATAKQAVATVFDQLVEELEPRLGLAGDPGPAFDSRERSPR